MATKNSAKEEATGEVDTTIEDGTEPTKIASLAELAGGLGHKLELIEGHRVTVIGLRYEIRPVHVLKEEAERTGVEEGSLVDKEIAQIITAGPGDTEEVYYTFSAPLISKLKSIPEGGLPAQGTFRRIDIANGRRVWSIE